MLPVISDPESLTPVGAAGSADETGSTVDLLADPRRRSILRYLEDCEEAVSLSDLADHMTLEEQDHRRGAIAECGDALLGTRRRVRIALRHVHVPKLAADGAVDFNPDENTVSLRGAGADLLARACALETAVDAGTRRPQPQ
ncbi:DUF7344 domain-containing protein [Haloterrigena alkaliphila]|uniref:ArsR family transcriptional regulator n=1 Tax=Haloterrigena alkaliphila TaxID=2816475 RepID=A0A8A2VCI1_9EURY|nr:ArsR family transcriptional regulator [Haloterrigena alkaliphila]QSW98896.1 ArsR family transcriptional regulator [Haloterrigena alkaliphila]